MAEDAVLECRICGGPSALMGVLGDRRWYRCRDCGFEEHERIEMARGRGGSLGPDVVGGEERRELILTTAKDLAIRFLVYDRKEDEELPLGAIQECFEWGDITTGEIVGAFIDGLEEHWNDNDGGG